ncbi:MmcQ/YjbR family DNA-binding protein [Actinokineospora enzanensis]|uniref:MmcQ/YjbR family DNA-binding protein n=1 Tax=Actinokineospora enzanensis TaxID=155975 RepID=UPI001B7FB835|nr:MmcQ/YjbR family DNA-binding protein [Actinokineospora enzanensis]
MDQYDAMMTEADVRRAALALPGTSERSSYGTPGFRVRDKLFARLKDAETLVAFCADESEKLALIAEEPGRYYSTPHYDGYPSVLVRLSALDEDGLADVLLESWRVRAPRKLVAEFDAAPPQA